MNLSIKTPKNIKKKELTSNIELLAGQQLAKTCFHLQNWVQDN
jgi:hypothetical protein